MPGNLKIDKDFETRKCTTSIGEGGGGGGATPLYGLYKYVGPKGVF